MSLNDDNPSYSATEAELIAVCYRLHQCFDPDVAQTAMVKVMNYLACGHQVRDLEHFAFRVAKRARVDHYRVAHRHQTLATRLHQRLSTPCVADVRAEISQTLSRASPEILAILLKLPQERTNTEKTRLHRWRQENKQC